LADPKFLIELSSPEEQKFWACISEGLVHQLLIEKTFGDRRNLGKGPDFLVQNGSQRIWIEVTCPEPTDLPENWKNVAWGEASSVPHDLVLLRWTSAIKAKAIALIGDSSREKPGYLQTGMVGQDDAYVIAVNACRLRHGQFPGILGISQLPYAVEATLPVGPYAVQIDSKSLQVVDRGHQYRPFLINKNNSEVSTKLFFDPQYSGISAIWALDLNGASAIGNFEPIALVHNPNATNPLPLGFLPSQNEYTVVIGESEFGISNQPGTSPPVVNL
jgi:type I restriction enzyme S subunit